MPEEFSTPLEDRRRVSRSFWFQNVYVGFSSNSVRCNLLIDHGLPEWAMRCRTQNTYSRKRMLIRSLSTAKSMVDAATMTPPIPQQTHAAYAKSTNVRGNDMSQQTPKIPAKADPQLSLEKMKQFVKDHFEVFVNQKDSSQAYRSFTEDFLDHDEPTGVAVGAEAAKTMMEAAYKRWPDLHVVVEDALADGDKVVVRNVWTATERASGEKITFSGFVMWRFANAKIVERWATLIPPHPVLEKS